jgi:hypothetical protein
VAVDYGFLGNAHAGADARIKHPGRDPFARLIGESDVNYVAVPARSAEDFVLLAKERVVGI